MSQEWKRVKARKDHKCEGCDEQILKGEMYDFLSFRSPNFDKNDVQIGIEYVKIRSHLAELNCHWPDECKNGNHSKVEYNESDPYSSDCGKYFVYCENCGTDLSKDD
jgi:hypothetical protein